MSDDKSKQTIGEKRVRTKFNPSGVGNVNFIKENSAKLINVCDDMKPKEGEKVDPEKLRLIALAQTAYEEATHWAVKAATFNE